MSLPIANVPRKGADRLVFWAEMLRESGLWHVTLSDDGATLSARPFDYEREPSSLLITTQFHRQTSSMFVTLQGRERIIRSAEAMHMFVKSICEVAP